MTIELATFSGFRAYILAVTFLIGAIATVFLNFGLFAEKIGHKDSGPNEEQWTLPTLSLLIDNFFPSNYIWTLLFICHLPIRLFALVIHTKYTWFYVQLWMLRQGYNKIPWKNFVFRIPVCLQIVFGFVEVGTVAGVALFPETFLDGFSLLGQPHFHAFCANFFGYSSAIYAVASCGTQYAHVTANLHTSKLLKGLYIGRIILSCLMVATATCIAISISLRRQQHILGYTMFPVAEYCYLLLTTTNHVVLVYPMFVQIKCRFKTQHYTLLKLKRAEL